MKPFKRFEFDTTGNVFAIGFAKNDLGSSNKYVAIIVGFLVIRWNISSWEVIKKGV